MAPQKRQPRGSGSIYLHKASGLWACVVPLEKDAAGKRRRRVIYGKTRGEVRAKVFDLQVRSGGAVRARAHGTLRDWVTSWLTDEVKPNRASATWVSYENAWRVHVEPLIGSVALEDLSVDHVLRMMRDQRARGVSASMTARCCRVMHRAIAVAIRHGRFTRPNPFAQIDRPKPEYREKRALSIDEARLFLAAAADDRFEALWLLLLTAGLRLGEALALRWTDVDFNRRTIAIRRSRSEAIEPHTKDTKNAYSRRDVPFGEIALAGLRRRQAKYDTETHGSDLVFSSTAGTAMLNSNLKRRHFAPLLERAKIEGLQIRDLRRSSASIGAAAGIGPRAMADRLGHATTRMTMEVYTQVMQGMEAAAAAAIDAALVPPKRRAPRPAAEKRPERTRRKSAR
jgi:integrase